MKEKNEILRSTFLYETELFHSTLSTRFQVFFFFFTEKNRYPGRLDRPENPSNWIHKISNRCLQKMSLYFLICRISFSRQITRLDSSGEARLNSNTLTLTVKVPETWQWSNPLVQQFLAQSAFNEKRAHIYTYVNLYIYIRIIYIHTHTYFNTSTFFSLMAQQQIFYFKLSKFRRALWNSIFFALDVFFIFFHYAVKKFFIFKRWRCIQRSIEKIIVQSDLYRMVTCAKWERRAFSELKIKFIFYIYIKSD